MLSASIIQDRRDDPVNSRRGIYNTIDMAIALRAFGSETDFTRVLLRAGVSFWVIAVSIVANIALVVYMYWTYLPPREAAWERERRRQAYFPKANRRRKRRR